MLQFLPLISGIIDKVVPDRAAAQKAKDKLAVLEQKGELDLVLGQLEINKEEAKSEHLFVSGARPFILWVCGFIFCYHYILYPLIQLIAAIMGVDITTLPVSNLQDIWPVMGGLLGLGGFRTYEKFKGVNKNR